MFVAYCYDIINYSAPDWPRRDRHTLQQQLPECRIKLTVIVIIVIPCPYDALWRASASLFPHAGYQDGWPNNGAARIRLLLFVCACVCVVRHPTLHQ